MATLGKRKKATKSKTRNRKGKAPVIDPRDPVNNTRQSQVPIPMYREDNVDVFDKIQSVLHGRAAKGLQFPERLSPDPASCACCNAQLVESIAPCTIWSNTSCKFGVPMVTLACSNAPFSPQCASQRVHYDGIDDALFVLRGDHVFDHALMKSQTDSIMVNGTPAAGWYKHTIRQLFNNGSITHDQSIFYFEDSTTRNIFNEALNQYILLRTSLVEAVAGLRDILPECPICKDHPPVLVCDGVAQGSKKDLNTLKPKCGEL